MITMKEFVLYDGTYNSIEEEEAVFEIVRRMGWKAEKDKNDNIIIEYPEKDEIMFDMMMWNLENNNPWKN